MGLWRGESHSSENPTLSERGLNASSDICVVCVCVCVFGGYTGTMSDFGLVRCHSSSNILNNYSLTQLNKINLKKKLN